MKWLSGLYLIQASCSNSLFPSGTYAWVPFVRCFLGCWGLLSVNCYGGVEVAWSRQDDFWLQLRWLGACLLHVDVFPSLALNFWIGEMLMRLCFLPLETVSSIFVYFFFFLIDTPFFLERGAMVLPVFEVTSRRTFRPQEGVLLNSDQFCNVRNSPFWEIQKNSEKCKEYN